MDELEVLYNAFIDNKLITKDAVSLEDFKSADEAAIQGLYKESVEQQLITDVDYSDFKSKWEVKKKEPTQSELEKPKLDSSNKENSGSLVTPDLPKKVEVTTLDKENFKVPEFKDPAEVKIDEKIKESTKGLYNKPFTIDEKIKMETEYKSATNISKKEEDAIRKGIEDDDNNVGVWNTIKEGAKKWWNNVFDVEPAIQLETDNLAESRGEAAKLLENNNPNYTDKDLKEATYKIEYDKRKTSLKEKKSSDYIQKLQDNSDWGTKAYFEDKFGVEAEQKKAKSFTLASEIDALDNDIKTLENGLKDLHQKNLTGYATELDRKTFIETRDRYLSQVSLLDKKILDFNKVSEEATNAAKEVDLFKRNYDKWDNAITRFGTAFGDIFLNIGYLLNEVNQMNTINPVIPYSTSLAIEKEIASGKSYIQSRRDDIKKNIDVTQIGSWQDALEWGLNTTMEQAPITITLAATGGAGLAVLGASESGAKAFEIDEFEKETGEYYDPLKKVSSMFLAGSVTYLSERITLGQLGKVKRVFSPVSVKEIKTSAKDYFKRNYKEYFTDVAEENLSEFSETFGSNVIDKYILGKDVQLLDGVDANLFASATFMANIHKSPLLARDVIKGISPKDINQKIGENSNLIFSYNNTLKTEKLTEKETKVLNKKIDDLLIKNEKLINKSVKDFQKLEPSKQNRLFEIESNTYSLRKEYQETKNGNYDKKTKESILNDIVRTTKKMLNEREDIISGKYSAKDSTIDFLKEVGGTVEDISDVVDGVVKTDIDGTEVLIKSKTEDGKETIVLESIVTPKENRNQGNAKKALDKLTETADKNDVSIELKVVPQDETIDSERLKNLYKEYGFVEKGNQLMVREPNVDTTFTGIDSVINEAKENQNIETETKVDNAKKVEVKKNPEQTNITVETNSNTYDVSVKDGKLEIKAQLGNPKISDSERQNIVNSYIEQTDFNQGEVADFSNAPNANDEQQSEIIAESSNNPIEIINEIRKVQQRSSEKEVNLGTTKEQAIADALSNNALVNDAKKEVTDLGSYYTNVGFRTNKDKKSIDQIREIAQSALGQEVSYQDVLDFLNSYPKLSDFKQENSIDKSPIENDLKDRFKQVTGLNPTKSNFDKILPETETIVAEDIDVELNEDDEIPFQTQSNQGNISGNALRDIINRLKKTGLAKNVRVLGQKQIDNVLDKIGLNKNVKKSIDLEMDYIKKEAIKNNVFMLAPNGKKTNLTEQQWLSVRTESFKGFFGDWENNVETSSKTLDENGEPLILHHGTNQEFDEFDSSKILYIGNNGDGFYFSPDKHESERYGENVRDFFVSIKNPLEPKQTNLSEEDYRDLIDAIWEDEEYSQDLKNYGYFDDSDYIIFRNEKAKEFFDMKDDYRALFDLSHTATGSVRYLSEKVKDINGIGYDGVISRGFREYVSFIPNNIKSATNNNGLFSSAEPNIYYQKEESKILKEEGDLAVVHNISPRKLAHALKVGGLPVPSIAVVNTNNPYTSFGEITLVADKDMIDPRASRLNNVFGADIYSIRYPNITYDIKWKSFKSLQERVEKAFKFKLRGRGLSHQDIENDGRREIEDNPQIQLLFMQEKGLLSETIMDEPNVDVSDSELEVFEKLANTTNIRNIQDYNFIQRDGSKYNEFKKLVEGIAQREINEIDDADVKEHIKNRWYKDGKINKYLLNDKFRSLKTALRFKYEPEIDVRETLRTNNFNLNSEEYQSFVDEILDELNPKEKIFKGYDSQGNRRYVPHTLENVVRMMKNKTRDSEGFMYGLGSVRSNVTPQFKSISDIKKNKSRLVTSKEFDKVKEEMNEEFFALSSSMDPYIKNDLRTSTELSAEGMVEVWHRGYAQDFDLPQNMIDNIMEFMSKLEQMPTEYFEAKINRAVQLSEFKTAIVPNDTPTSLINQLSKMGLNVKKYNNKEKYSGNRLDNIDEHLRFQKELSDSGASPIQKNQKVNGFVYDGVVYLNRDRVKADTPIHEFGHLWNSYIKENHKDVYKRGLEVISGTEYHNQVKLNDAYKHLSEEEQLEEALAQAIGEKGVKILNESKKKSFAQWFKTLFNRIARGLGLRNMTGEQLANIKLDEFTSLAAAELLSGQEIVSRQKERANKNEQESVNKIDIVVETQKAILEERKRLKELIDSKRTVSDAVKDRIEKYINDQINSKNIDEVKKREIKSLLSTIKKARTKRNMVKAFEKIDDIFLRVENRVILNDINKILDKKLTKKEYGRRKSNLVTEEVAFILNTVKKYTKGKQENVSPLKSKNKDNSLLSQAFDRREEIVNQEDISDQDLLELEAIGIAIEILSAKTTTNHSAANVRLKETLETVTNIYENGRSDLKALKEETNNYLDKQVKAYIKDADGTGKRTTKTDAQLDKEFKKTQNIVGRTLFDIGSGFMTGSLDSLMTIVSKKGGESRDSSPLIQLVNRLKQKETFKKRRIAKFSNEVIQAQKDIFGSQRKADIVLNQKRDFDIVSNPSYGDENTPKIKETITHTNSELLNLWMNYQNPKLRSGLAKSGYTDQFFSDLKLPQEVLEYGDFLFDVYERLYPETNYVYKKMFYHSMGQEDFYAGKVSRKDIETEATELAPDGNNFSVNTTGYGSQKERGSDKPIQATDANLNILRAIAETSHFVAFAEIHREYSKMVNDGEFSQVVRLNNGNNGDKIMSLLKKYKERDLEKGGVQEGFKILDILGRNITRSTLALKTKVGITQMISFLNGAVDMPSKAPKKFLSYYNPIDIVNTMKELMKESEYLKTRYDIEGIENAVTGLSDIATDSEFSLSNNVADANRKETSRFIGKMFKYALANVKYGDFVGLAGGVPAYMAWVDTYKARGMSEKKAKEKALKKFEASVDRSQQTISTFGKSQFQKHPILRYLAMFATSPIQNMQNANYHWRELYRGLTKGQDMAKGTPMRNVMGILNYHFAQPMMYTYISQLMAANIFSAFGFGDEEPDDIDKSLAASFLFSNYGSIPVIGGAGVLAIDEMLGKDRSFGGIGSSPVIDFLQGLSDDYKNMANSKNKKSQERYRRKLLTKLTQMSLSYPTMLSDLYFDWNDVYWNDDVDEMVKLEKVLGWSNYTIKESRKKRKLRVEAQREKNIIDKKFKRSEEKNKNRKTDPLLKKGGNNR